MSTLFQLVDPLIAERKIVGLTGGGVTKLDGIVTVGLALSPIPRAEFILGGSLQVYKLRAGTDAESSPNIIRPDDYATTTNEKVWELINFASGSLLAANNLSDLANPATARINLGVGAGTGDLLSTNNLSDVTDPVASLANIGGALASDLDDLTGAVSTLAGMVSGKLDATGGVGPAINLATRRLIDSATNGSVDWENRLLLDAAGQSSVDWDNHHLLDSTGALALDFSGGITGFLRAANNFSDVGSAATCRTNLGLVIGTNVQAYNANLTAWAALATSAKVSTSDIGVTVQAYATNLDAWALLATAAKLTTASNLSDVASAATSRSNLGLVIGTNVQAWNTNLDGWALIAPSSKINTTAIGVTVQAYATNLDAWALITTASKLTTASNLSDVASAATSRTNLGLVIGTNVEAWSANLDSWSAITPASKLTAASNLSDLGNAGSARTNLGVAIGSNVEAWSANLDAWSAITTASKLTAASNLSDVGSAATCRTNLGLVIGTNVQAYNANLTTWAGLTPATIGDITVGILTAAKWINTQSTLTYAGTTNIDFDADSAKTLSLTGNVTFTTSNKAAGKMKKIRIICDATLRTFTFPAGWVFLGAAAPASIAISKTAILTLECWGTADTDIIAAYSVQP